ncbi:beta-lactamase family protein [Sphingobacterium sp. SRCM116780]|uniref:serine hydrolase domain-containing protein n=1 Tax=Sphingobacterium sp. SRCM116780 TaxID=2907623 RepID=UPI001F162421|nr:serine hydrolase domain-containing protein [Sphingobacterium sp. SRCM116780]UIR56980.1 beta-lactamase family protein [Sphingobacterium sp. SRCM116780]
MVQVYGYRELSNKQISDKNTLYQTASMSKAINAVAVLKLVEEGKISLDEDIRKYLKTWHFPDNKFSDSKKITLENLLSHTGGLGTSGFFGYNIKDSIPTLNQILDGKAPANSDAVIPINYPDVAYLYSGGGTTVIRKILEDRFNKDYSEMIRTILLKPLKINRSTYNRPLDQYEKNYAVGYFGENQMIEGGYHIFPELAPDGLWSTSNDIGKVIVSIQHSLQGNPSLLNKESVLTMFARVIPSSNYALGFVVEEKGNETYFSHRGANYGYRGVFYGSMTSGKGIVVLTNSEHGEPLINEVVNSVAIAYNWKGFYNPPIKKLIAISPNDIDSLVGDYSNGDATFLIRNKNGKLEMTGNSTEVLYPIGNRKFFLLSTPNINVHFDFSNDEKTAHTLTIQENGKILITAIKK